MRKYSSNKKGIRERYKDGHLAERETNILSQHFNHLSYNIKLRNDFDSFMFENVMPLFTYASDENFVIKVSDIDARSVLYGKDNALFRHLANTFNMNPSNFSNYKDDHEALILRAILRESNGGDMRKFIRTIKKYLDLLRKEMFEWNVVYYGHYRQHYVVN